MNELAAKGGAGTATKDTLFLVFRIGTERYALQAIEVVEVLPRLQLKPIPRAPSWVAGVFAHRGAVVPVLDLSALTFGEPAQERTSTRLVLVHYRPQTAQPAQLLGLILEQATDTLRCNPQDFKAYGLDNRNAPYLGPVYEDAQGLLQWVCVDDLLDAEVRALLFPSPPLDLALLGESS
ncbi:chemotaxis protein CheW [Pseudomonas chlororaphis]|uniref:chemotaxis protein CheW n=1 Tax=Pseudomonas chlororaphis TaxID=587753 RepID=UPI0006A5B02C|nr:chemotaxis protein CheW [Pseudomonas chlororaphis]AZD00348.1 Chemotaxis signal transduction protein [Pseudomonas chlororaphis subsp. chlororaphis]MBM0281677.1 purine-binding chemotaxis protein CheW [Pseudomonas chlororaphis]MDO1504070.1 purine-binding chemotaxis protein CheW [Pseudomonas chlororaphis]ORM49121.1 chemotaxis protein CheW [Pseudomonas chlororaphis subsp. chlororaphis]TWR94774.1 purine-binding chemotaxis protein CheW [Pseudomonas chlororaphis subsp. chlororaphis]